MQFVAEVEVLTKVQHPNLVRFEGYSTDGPQKCLVLECMDSALDTRLVSTSQPALGWQQLVTIALDVCRALVHLHSLSPPLFHRDVKCQNVLLNGFGTGQLDGGSVAKVADFG